MFPYIREITIPFKTKSFAALPVYFLLILVTLFFKKQKHSVIDQSTGLNVVLSLAFPNESNVV